MPEEINRQPVPLDAPARKEWIDFTGPVNAAGYLHLFNQASACLSGRGDNEPIRIRKKVRLNNGLVWIGN